MICALTPELRCCQCVAWFFQGARRTLDFFRTPPRNTAEPSPLKHWQVVELEMSSVIVPGGYILRARGVELVAPLLARPPPSIFPDDFVTDFAHSAQVAAEGLSTFAEVNAARVNDAIGPALLPPFVFDPALAAADLEAGRPDATLTDICMAYEKALRGNDWDFMEDSDDENAGGANAGGNDDEDEMNHLDHYIALLRVIRGGAALRRADGDLRGAEDLCRFAARAPAPSLMLMNLPDDGSVQVADARATSVELAAAGPTLWAAVGAARAAAAKLLGDVITDDPAELRALADRREAFFMNLTGADLASEAARAAHLAEKLAQQDEGAARGDAGALSMEEEEELVGLLKKNKRWLSGKDSDDEDSDSDGEGILANLAAEDEELPEEMRKEAVDKLEAELREMEAKAKK